MVIFINFKGFTKYVPTANRVIYQCAVAHIKWNKVQTKRYGHRAMDGAAQHPAHSFN